MVDDTLEGWYPSLDEYTPGFTSKDWLTLLENPKIFHENDLRVLKEIYEHGGAATCTELGNSSAESPFFYSTISANLAKRICKETDCPKPPIRKSGHQRWWPVLYVGKDVKDGRAGSYIWKLRPELEEAFKQYISTHIINNEHRTMTQNYPKNQILFGPPGTGKTYSTVLHAVSIIDNISLETLKQESYKTVLKRYQQYRGEGSIASVTFHQSYGYEEFIEGIRPILDDNGTTSLSYMLENGVFKEFCQRAKTKDNITIPKKLLNKEPTIWKISLYGSGENAVKTDCFENDRIRIAFYKDLDYGKAIYNAFNNKMQIGDIVLSLYSNKEIDGIGIITSDAVELDDVESYRNSRSVHWVATNIRVNIIEYNEEKVLTMGTVYELSRFSLKVVEEIVEKLQSRNNAPYVFIIDEINRGNISKIFGELISLIEPSKRLGAAESMTVQLPYSKQDFGVPQNVYIIGTMNTADRSLAFLDTALRRRFTFTEMLPNPQLLKGIEIEGIDVSLMLAKINERIEALYDREHTIGHAYFMILKDNPTIECLADVFSTAIIPLLQEYFFNDYEKIRLVLGDNYKNDALSFIREIPINCRELFHCDVDEVCDVRYEINKEALYTPEAYQKIYQA